MNIIDLKHALNNLNCSISDIINRTGFTDDEKLYLNNEPNNPDELFLTLEFEKVLLDLVKVNERLNYLNRPIQTVTYICKNKDGRYAAKYTGTDGQIKEYIYTSGSGIEFLYTNYDEDEERYTSCWKTSRVEYDGGYYIIDYPGIDMDFLTVRIRK